LSTLFFHQIILYTFVYFNANCGQFFVIFVMFSTQSFSYLMWAMWPFLLVLVGLSV
jgi:hypothetical protein